MPEEINRIVTDSLADILFTPSYDANENLRKEGIPEHRVKMVGNIMIDTLVANLDKARSKNTLENLGLKDKEFVYVTLHRPSNVDEKEILYDIMTQLEGLSDRCPLSCRSILEQGRCLMILVSKLNNHPHLLVTDPIGYHDAICLTEHARFVITDSGGVQEETTFLQIPCLTLRPNTERPITLTEGNNKLTDPKRMWSDIEAILKQPERSGRIPPLWDGKTAERIVHVLHNLS